MDPIGDKSFSFSPPAKSLEEPVNVPRSVPLIRAVSSGDRPLFLEHEVISTVESSVVAIHNLIFIIIIPA